LICAESVNPREQERLHSNHTTAANFMNAQLFHKTVKLK